MAFTFFLSDHCTITQWCNRISKFLLVLQPITEQIRQSSVWYAESMDQWDDRLIDQVFDVSGIILFIISCKILCKNPSNIIFSSFIILQKINQRVLSALSPSQQPTVLFSIYQNNTWTIRRLVYETIDPATQRIILKIVGF